MENSVDRHLMIVIGGTGDLMRRKILPAMRRLTEEGALKERIVILASGRRTKFDDGSYREWAHEALEEAGLPPGAEGSGWCERCLHYQSVGDQEREDFERLKERIEEL
ncbi:MAG: glucose-6-phosphate dehydrogenase, partial [Armatimonadota bacterium]